MPLGVEPSQQISIHALREEGDQPPEFVLLVFIVFQSTPSARRATCRRFNSLLRSSNFNPRPPRGGRPLPSPYALSHISYFNPRPPRGGRPKPFKLVIILVKIFQSTPSARRATYQYL